MQILWFIAILLGWLGHFTIFHRSSISLSLMLIGSVVFYFSFRSGLRKAFAANNVVAAAATFKAQQQSDQERIHEHAIGIIKMAGWRSDKEPTFANDVIRFGWYALAMNELSIPPVCITPSWHHVRNPFLAISKDDSYIDTALQLAQKQGFVVTLHRE